MPKTLNNSYDALVIVFENSDQKESTFLERELNHVFESQRILYFKNQSMTGNGLFQEIWNRIDSRTVFLPPSQRMIICNYIDLDSVNEKWLQNFRQFMQDFRNATGATSWTQHQYLTFLKYRAGKILTIPMENLVETLNAMWKTSSPMPMQHTEYLLYAGGFNNFDSQEKGIIRLLKTLSSQSWDEVYDLAKCKNALHILAFDEYYEKKALICQQELEKIQDWLYKVGDPKLDNFYIELQQSVRDLVTSYQEKMRKFERWLGLYPVSICEFTAHGFGPFKKYIRKQMRSSELEKQRAEYQELCMAEYQDCEIVKKLYVFFETHFFYSDYKNIQAADESGGIDKRIHNIIESCGEKLSEEEKKGFEELLLKVVREYINDKLENLEEIKREKEDERIRYMYEQNLTTKYQNLPACFDGIFNGTVYQVLPSLPPATLMTFTYINTDVANDWVFRKHHVNGVDDENVLIDEEINPLEIQHLKIGRYLNLNTPETLGNFKMVIH